MGGLRDRLRARARPTEVVTHPPAQEGDEPERIELRALSPDVWEALVAAHPPTEEQRGHDAPWNYVTFRPALLAAAVVTPDGEEPLTEDDWRELAAAGAVAAGELNLLFRVAIELNDRSPLARVGKG